MEVMQGRMDCHLIEMCVPEKSQGNTSQNEVGFRSQVKVLLPTKSCLPPSAECRQPDLRNGQGDPNETTNSLSRAQASSLSAGSQHIPNLSLITIAVLSRWKGARPRHSVEQHAWNGDTCLALKLPVFRQD